MLSSLWAGASVDASLHDDASCHVDQDPVAVYLSMLLCVGLIVSYLPQIIRIVLNKSSQGFSPWFLLLGATSSASSFLNVVALQWGIVRCCSSLSTLKCSESLLGILQVGLQWFMFATVLVLFLIYYPADQRYERAIALPHRDQQDRRLRSQARKAARRAAAVRQVPSHSTESTGRLAAPSKAPRALASTSTDDISSAGSDNSDLDSVDSHIAQNYASIPAQRDGDDTSSDGGDDDDQDHHRDPEALLQPTRFNNSHPRDVSSSAFSRLAPAFWPMWKAPGSDNTGASQQTRSSAQRGILSNAPRGIRRIERQRRAKIGQRAIRTRKRRTEEWSLAVALAWVVLIHFIFISAITLLLVSSLPPKSFPPPEEVSALSSWTQAIGNMPTIALSRPSSRLLVSRWAAFLGSSATVLAAGQYLPQIVYTTRSKLVGSLSIPMMCLQVPGSAIFVYSLALQPGTDWSSLAAYVLTGALQLVLLVLCVAWRFRQKRAGVDDYGRPLAAVAL
ncbi:uncharacterized protein MEPE_00040 [Melanopsichium pennsylvanicum]|uniref:Uncharacterized protein n=2 Tax=Melanopsichium pennsylvanicum TaxID=63383 RepID=A0AAJ4XF65_9BASI|nr:uncharacterized protein MEPE_00040 [Melanopsichium pennsylvanicum]